MGLQGGFPASNNVSQDFLVKFTLDSDTMLGGGDIYSEYKSDGGSVNLGDDVVIKFRGDDGGQPGASNLLTFDSKLSAIDSDGASSNPRIQRLHADFDPTLFTAGTYWFGMSAAGAGEIAWNIDFSNPNTLGAWQLSGDSLQFAFSDQTTLAYRLDGPAGVPEPASWALMIGGFGLAGAALRRRTVVAA